mmetsp:Transcript_906/g.2702  ORF Transcript_906/g.2702 Transcript_906/m.2702 type:complete len:211 (-) Transcript_906:483-1115(-)
MRAVLASAAPRKSFATKFGISLASLSASSSASKSAAPKKSSSVRTAGSGAGAADPCGSPNTSSSSSSSAPLCCGKREKSVSLDTLEAAFGAAPAPGGAAAGTAAAPTDVFGNLHDSVSSTLPTLSLICSIWRTCASTSSHTFFLRPSFIRILRRPPCLKPRECAAGAPCVTVSYCAATPVPSISRTFMRWIWQLSAVISSSLLFLSTDLR